MIGVPIGYQSTRSTAHRAALTGERLTLLVFVPDRPRRTSTSCAGQKVHLVRRELSLHDTGLLQSRVSAGSSSPLDRSRDDLLRPRCLDLPSHPVRRRGQRQLREHRPPAAVGGAAAIRSSPESVPAGSTLLGLPFTPLDGLAVPVAYLSTPPCSRLASQRPSAPLALEITNSDFRPPPHVRRD